MGRGLVIGAAIGAVLAFLAVTAGTIVWTKKQAADMKRGWNLVPVLTTARAIRRGEPIAADAVKLRETPEQFVTVSLVPADQREAVVGRIALADLPADAMLYLSDLEPTQPTALEQCLRTVPSIER